MTSRQQGETSEEIIFRFKNDQDINLTLFDTGEKKCATFLNSICNLSIEFKTTMYVIKEN